MATTAPRAIPGASVDGQRREMSSENSSSTLNSTNTSTSTATTTTVSPPAKSASARRHSYVPRWDANGNSHHPIPSTSTSSSTMSSKNNSSSNNSNDSVVTSPPSAILSLLGLRPSPKRSGAVPLPPVAAGRGNNHAGHGHGHARNNPSISSTTSTAYYDTTEDNLLDGDFDDDDGPPEPITPPQSTLAPLTSSTHAAAKSGKDIGGNKPARTATPTHFGNELDEASKFELDDVFDGNASIGSIARSPPSTSAHSTGNNAGIPISSSSNSKSGRRASWSAASGNGAQHVYSASAPGTSLMSWLHSQQLHTPQAGVSAGSSSTSHNNNNADKSALDLGRGARPIPIDQHGSTSAGAAQTAPVKEATAADFGSSPVGLFRRLSLSYTNRRPQVPAPPSTASQLSGDNNHSNNADDPRIGRPLTRVTSAPPRKLSPMGERMLRAHYDSFS